MFIVPSDCQLCRLCEGRTNVVPGAGNNNAELLFIGEGPGKKEDELGVPFVGAAGKFLDELLNSIGLKRKDIFITNIVKCRPPNNRDPLQDEKKTCTENYLIEQINNINPTVVVTLGRHAANFFFPKLIISKSHGTYMKGKKKNGDVLHFFPMYHPAAALYNGSMRSVLKDDMLKLNQLLKNLKENA